MESPRGHMVRRATQLALPRQSKLPLRTLWGYGSVALGIYASDLTLNLLLQIFLLDVALISPFYAGIIAAAAEITEMVSSMLIGVLSDKTQSRYGKRRPWIFWGAIIGALSLAALFFKLPSEWGETTRFVYYLIAIIVTSLSFPAVSIPHQALGPEITEDYDQRLNIATARSAFSFAGMLLVAIYLLCIFNFFDHTSNEQFFLFLVAFPSVSTLVLGIVCFLSVRPHSYGDYDPDLVKARGPSHPCTRLALLICIPSFMMNIVIFAFAGLVSSVALSLFPLYIIHVLGLTFATFSQALIVMMAFTVLTIWILSRIGGRYEKKNVLCFGAACGMLAYTLFFIVPGPGISDWAHYSIFAISALAGVANSIAFTMPNAMMADCTDLALLKYRSKQEGFMFSSMETCQSLFQAFVGFFVGLLLELQGYTTTGAQPLGVQRLIRVLFCVIPVFSFFIVWIVSAFFPITRRGHREILSKIKKIKNMDVSEDVPSSAAYASNHLATSAMWDAGGTMKLQRKKNGMVRKASLRLHSDSKLSPQTPLKSHRKSMERENQELYPPSKADFDSVDKSSSEGYEDI